jgi:hypothetical protein
MRTFLLILLLGACVHGAYWDLEAHELGFFPRNKSLGSCFEPSLKALCAALTNETNSENIILAARELNLSSIMASNEMEREDAHHWLSIAACRIGADFNRLGEEMKPPQSIHIDASLSLPLLLLSKNLSREPLIGYPAMVLDNCVRDEAFPPFTREGWKVLRTITSPRLHPEDYKAETGFYAAHCAVEYAFAPVLATLHSLTTLSSSIRNGHDDAPEALASAVSLLHTIAFQLRHVVPVFKTMRTFIHPTSFFNGVRHFLKCGNTLQNGIVFEGHAASDPITIDLPDMVRTVVPNVPVFIRGPSGAMTSTLPFVDAALGITTAMDADRDLAHTMADFRRFQPREHAAHTDNVARGNAIRTFVLSANALLASSSDSRPYALHAQLVDAYDDAITAVAEVRGAHVDHIMTYIVQYAANASSIRGVSGTGGTPIAAYLCRAASGTLQARLRPGPASASVSLPAACVAQCLLDPADVGGLCGSLERTLCAMELRVCATDRGTSERCVACEAHSPGTASPIPAEQGHENGEGARGDTAYEPTHARSLDDDPTVVAWTHKRPRRGEL